MKRQVLKKQRVGRSILELQVIHINIVVNKTRQMYLRIRLSFDNTMLI